MNKDIWHFPSEAPAYCFQCVFYDKAGNEYHFGQYSPVFKRFRSGNAGWEHEKVQRFAFAKDIIACLGELERTRKTLDVAKDALKYANKCIKGGCVNWETEIDKALDKITATLENQNGNC